MDTHGHIIETPWDQSQDVLVIFPNLNIYKYVNPDNKFPKLKGILKSWSGSSHIWNEQSAAVFLVEWEHPILASLR